MSVKKTAVNVNEVKCKKYNLIGGGMPFGCKTENGKIVPALSFGKTYKCPKGVRYAVYVPYSNRYYAMNATALYNAFDFEAYSSVAYVNSKLPFFVEYRKDDLPAAKVVFDERAILFHGLNETLHNVPYRICGGVYKNGRVFAIDLYDSYKLRWSGEKGVDDWVEKIDGAGWLYVDTKYGEIVNLIVYKDHIAVIQKNGISLLDAHGTPEDFKITLSMPTRQIYRNCSVVCGGKLYFCAIDGLYAFNGSYAERVEIALAENFTSALYAAVYGSCVFVAGTQKKLERGVILVYDTEDKSSYYIDLAATAIVAGNYPYAYKDTSAVLLEKGTVFTYESELLGNFSKRKKRLESVFIDCDKNVDITVETESVRHTFKGVKGRLTTHVCGVNFKVSVTGTDAEIKAFTANVEYY